MVWSDKYAIEAGARQSDQPLDPPVSRLFIYRGKLKPVLVPYIYYSHTDLLRAPGAIVICCPADLVTNSATTRYILREYGVEGIVAKRPSMGSVIHLDPAMTKREDHHVFLMFTRATNRDPLSLETLHICLGELLEKLVENDIKDVHFPIIDPERQIIICLHGTPA